MARHGSPDEPHLWRGVHACVQCAPNRPRRPLSGGTGDSLSLRPENVRLGPLRSHSLGTPTFPPPQTLPRFFKDPLPGLRTLTHSVPSAQHALPGAPHLAHVGPSSLREEACLTHGKVVPATPATQPTWPQDPPPGHSPVQRPSPLAASRMSQARDVACGPSCTEPGAWEPRNCDLGRTGGVGGAVDQPWVSHPGASS